MSNTEKLSENDLYDVLSKLFDDMQKKGAIFDKSKPAIITSVIESLNKASVELTKDALKPQTEEEHGILHSLKGLLMGENIKKSNKLEESAKKPFQQLMDSLLIFLKLKKPEPKKKLTFLEHMKQELKKLFPKLFSKKEDKEGDKDKLDHEKKSELKHAHDANKKPDAPANTFNNLYSVDKFGNLTYPIMIIGDMIGLTNQNTGGSHDASYMADRKNVNPGELDYTGIENAAMNRVLSISDTSPELEKEIFEALDKNVDNKLNKPRTPFNTVPKNPNAK